MTSNNYFLNFSRSSIISFRFISQDCHCARPLRTVTDRILWPVRSDFSPRRERNGFRLHSRSPLARNSVEEENIKTLWRGGVRRLSVSRKNYSHVLRSLSLCLYLPPTNRILTYYTLFTIYDEGKKKPIRRYASVAVILSRRRSHRCWSNIILSHLSKPPRVL